MKIQHESEVLNYEPSLKTHSVLLNKGDTIYIFTDGFVEQFGGDKKKMIDSVFEE